MSLGKKEEIIEERLNGACESDEIFSKIFSKVKEKKGVNSVDFFLALNQELFFCIQRMEKRNKIIIKGIERNFERLLKSKSPKLQNEFIEANKNYFKTEL